MCNAVLKSYEIKARSNVQGTFTRACKRMRRRRMSKRKLPDARIRANPLRLSGGCILISSTSPFRRNARYYSRITENDGRTVRDTNCGNARKSIDARVLLSLTRRPAVSIGHFDEKPSVMRHRCKSKLKGENSCRRFVIQQR